MIEKIIKGIVLQKFNLEDEYVVKILSQGGNILTLKTKLSDRRIYENKTFLKEFNIVEIEYFTSNLNSKYEGRIENSKIIKEFKDRNEISKNIINIIKNIALESNNSILTYKSLEKIIFSLEEKTFSFQHILVFMIIFLRQNGYQIIINKCAKCKNEKDIDFFSLYEGGLVCKSHEKIDKYKLSDSTIKKLIEINSLKNPLECKDLNFDLIEISKIQKMYKTFFENHIGINLYMLDKIL